MRGLVRRNLRLQLIAGIIAVLAMPVLASAAQNDASLATETTLAAEFHDHNGRTQATLNVTVTGEDRLPAAGAVSIIDNGRPLAGAILNTQGRTSIVLDLPAGDHALLASYTGDSTHQPSLSRPSRARAEAESIPDFQISVAPATLTLPAGSTGTVTASITPENSSALTAPMFVTLSCSGLPDQSSCTFTPENIEILPNATAAITSSMVIMTQNTSSSAARPGANPVSLAILLPGAFLLGGLAFSARRRRWLQRLALVALLGFVATLGSTACNARYNYYHHGPPVNPPTPAGTYTVDVSAQTSNGVTATTHTTTLALTVQ